MNPNEIAQGIEEEVVEVEETQDAETTEDVEAEVETETVEELRKKLATIEAQKEHWRKKASTPVKETETSSTLSSADLLAVLKADVHEDDMERVEKFAKMEGISIKEALKNQELKAMLSLREEQRNSAAAANVTNVRRGSTKVTDETLIAKANAGNLPEDDEGINRLIAAKLKRK